MKRRPVPEIGRIVLVVRGRDAGAYGVVLGNEGERFVWISDGDKRRVEKPKRKNVQHIQPTSEVALDVAETLQAGGRLTNARLRHALRLYRQAALDRSGEAKEEGDVNHGER